MIYEKGKQLFDKFVLSSTKLIFHVYLDNRCGTGIMQNVSKQQVYFMPYKDEVPAKLEPTKRLCNKIQSLLIYLFAFTIAYASLTTICHAAN